MPFTKEKTIQERTSASKVCNHWEIGPILLDRNKLICTVVMYLYESKAKFLADGPDSWKERKVHHFNGPNDFPTHPSLNTILGLLQTKLKNLPEYQGAEDA